MIVGTLVSGEKIKFVTGGTGIANIAATLDETVGMNLKEGLRYKINNVNVPIASEVLPSTAFSGTAKISVGTATPSAPATGDLWVDTN